MFVQVRPMPRAGAKARRHSSRSSPPGPYYSSGISQMSVDLVVRDLAHPSRTRIGHRPHSCVQGKAARFGAVGKVEARPGVPTAPFGSSFGPPPSPHGRPSPSSLAPRQSLPPTVNDHPRFGAARSRPIRPRIATNNSRGTATSASWNVTALAWWTTLAPILISFSVSVHVRTGRGSASCRRKLALPREVKHWSQIPCRSVGKCEPLRLSSKYGCSTYLPGA